MFQQIANDPLHQFQVNTILPLKLGSWDISFTNASLWMVIAVLGVSLFLTLGIQRRALVPRRWQLMVEMAYEFVANTVRSNAGEEGMRFFPLVFTLFMFVLFCNLFGMIPYSFTVTSHIIVTFAMAMFVFLTVILVGLMRHGLRFFKLFVPSGVPSWILPLIVPIELISFLSRPVSLSVRLFANMLAGHILLVTFALLTESLITAHTQVFLLKPMAILPFFMLVFLTAFEVLVAFLQAYIFTILTAVYIGGAAHPEH